METARGLSQGKLSPPGAVVNLRFGFGGYNYSNSHSITIKTVSMLQLLFEFNHFFFVQY